MEEVLQTLMAAQRELADAKRDMSHINNSATQQQQVKGGSQQRAMLHDDDMHATQHMNKDAYPATAAAVEAFNRVSSYGHSGHRATSTSTSSSNTDDSNEFTATINHYKQSASAASSPTAMGHAERGVQLNADQLTAVYRYEHNALHLLQVAAHSMYTVVSGWNAYESMSKRLDDADDALREGSKAAHSPPVGASSTQGTEDGVSESSCSNYDDSAEGTTDNHINTNGDVQPTTLENKNDLASIRGMFWWLLAAHRRQKENHGHEMSQLHEAALAIEQRSAMMVARDNIRQHNIASLLCQANSRTLVNDYLAKWTKVAHERRAKRVATVAHEAGVERAVGQAEYCIQAIRHETQQELEAAKTTMKELAQENLTLSDETKRLQAVLEETRDTLATLRETHSHQAHLLRDTTVKRDELQSEVQALRTSLREANQLLADQAASHKDVLADLNSLHANGLAEKLDEMKHTYECLLDSEREEACELQEELERELSKSVTELNAAHLEQTRALLRGTLHLCDEAFESKATDFATAVDGVLKAHYEATSQCITESLEQALQEAQQLQEVVLEEHKTKAEVHLANQLDAQSSRHEALCDDLHATIDELKEEVARKVTPPRTPPPMSTPTPIETCDVAVDADDDLLTEMVMMAAAEQAASIRDELQRQQAELHYQQEELQRQAEELQWQTSPHHQHQHEVNTPQEEVTQEEAAATAMEKAVSESRSEWSRNTRNNLIATALEATISSTQTRFQTLRLYNMWRWWTETRVVEKRLVAVEAENRDLRRNGTDLMENELVAVDEELSGMHTTLRQLTTENKILRNQSRQPSLSVPGSPEPKGGLPLDATTGSSVFGSFGAGGVDGFVQSPARGHSYSLHHDPLGSHSPHGVRGSSRSPSVSGLHPGVLASSSPHAMRSPQSSNLSPSAAGSTRGGPRPQQNASVLSLDVEDFGTSSNSGCASTHQVPQFNNQSSVVGVSSVNNSLAERTSDDDVLHESDSSKLHQDSTGVFDSPSRSAAKKQQGSDLMGVDSGSGSTSNDNTIRSNEGNPFNKGANGACTPSGSPLSPAAVPDTARGDTNSSDGGSTTILAPSFHTGATSGATSTSSPLHTPGSSSAKRSQHRLSIITEPSEDFKHRRYAGGRHQRVLSIATESVGDGAVPTPPGEESALHTLHGRIVSLEDENNYLRESLTTHKQDLRSLREEWGKTQAAQKAKDAVQEEASAKQGQRIYELDDEVQTLRMKLGDAEAEIQIARETLQQSMNETDEQALEHREQLARMMQKHAVVEMLQRYLYGWMQVSREARNAKAHKAETERQHLQHQLAVDRVVTEQRAELHQLELDHEERIKDAVAEHAQEADERVATAERLVEVLEERATAASSEHEETMQQQNEKWTQLLEEETAALRATHKAELTTMETRHTAALDTKSTYIAKLTAKLEELGGTMVPLVASRSLAVWRLWLQQRKFVALQQRLADASAAHTAPTGFSNLSISGSSNADHSHQQQHRPHPHHTPLSVSSSSRSESQDTTSSEQHHPHRRHTPLLTVDAMDAALAQREADLQTQFNVAREELHQEHEMEKQKWGLRRNALTKDLEHLEEEKRKMAEALSDCNSDLRLVTAQVATLRREEGASQQKISDLKSTIAALKEQQLTHEREYTAIDDKYHQSLRMNEELTLMLEEKEEAHKAELEEAFLKRPTTATSTAAPSLNTSIAEDRTATYVDPAVMVPMLEAQLEAHIQYSQKVAAQAKELGEQLVVHVGREYYLQWRRYAERRVNAQVLLRSNDECVALRSQNAALRRTIGEALKAERSPSRLSAAESRLGSESQLRRSKSTESAKQRSLPLATTEIDQASPLPDRAATPPRQTLVTHGLPSSSTPPEEEQHHQQDAITAPFDIASPVPTDPNEHPSTSTGGIQPPQPVAVGTTPTSPDVCERMVAFSRKVSKLRARCGPNSTAVADSFCNEVDELMARAEAFQELYEHNVELGTVGREGSQHSDEAVARRSTSSSKSRTAEKWQHASTNATTSVPPQEQRSVSAFTTQTSYRHDSLRGISPYSATSPTRGGSSREENTHVSSKSTSISQGQGSTDSTN